ncbi:MAG TPA: Na+/H+ antiporter subunit E [Erythrobacter sp.]|nr:Na+/H+ antiporter subunit E [Erythrobacter sp.]
MVWLVLAGTTVEALAVGLVLAPLALALSLKLLPAGVPVRIWPVMRLLPHFVIQSLVGGIDVARRAFAPRMPLDPGWVEIDIDLPEGGRVALGGELSLMPGTLAAGTSEGRLLVHVLDRNQDVESVIRQEEQRLRLAIVRTDGKGAPI